MYFLFAGNKTIRVSVIIQKQTGGSMGIMVADTHEAHIIGIDKNGDITYNGVKQADYGSKEYWDEKEKRYKKLQELNDEGFFIR